MRKRRRRNATVIVCGPKPKHLALYGKRLLTPVLESDRIPVLESLWPLTSSMILSK